MLKNLICLCAVSSIALAEVVDYHAHPQYSFEYGVNDPGTQDVKKHWETRNGDKVEGSYSFKEADGTVRIVEYHANDQTGFNAVVRREGHAAHPPAHHYVHTPVQTFEHHAPHTPIESTVNVPTRTHTIIQTSVNHKPMETLLYTPVNIPIHNPAFSFVSSSVSGQNTLGDLSRYPAYTPEQNSVHSFVSSSVSTHHPMETIAHVPIQTAIRNPIQTGVHYSVRSPVHIPVETPIHSSVQTPVHIVHNSLKTPEYTVLHNSRKISLGTSIHNPIEATVEVPVNHVPVTPEVRVHHTARTLTKSIEHEKEPQVYNSQIAGAHSSSLISTIA